MLLVAKAIGTDIPLRASVHIRARVAIVFFENFIFSLHFPPCDLFKVYQTVSKLQMNQINSAAILLPQLTSFDFGLPGSLAPLDRVFHVPMFFVCSLGMFSSATRDGM